MKYIKLTALLLSIIVVFTACSFSLSEISAAESNNSISSVESSNLPNNDTILMGEESNNQLSQDTSKAVISTGVSENGSNTIPSESKSSTFSNNTSNCEEESNQEHEQSDTSLPAVTPCEHNFSSIHTYEPTCTSEGTIVYECDCGELKVEKVAKRPHNYELFSVIEPTFTAQGTRIYQCTMCKSTYKETIDILHKNAVDTDMCGDSLIKKALPHLPMYDVMKDMLDIYNKKHVRYNGTHINKDGYYYLPEWLDEDEFYDFLCTYYRYLWYELPAYLILEEDKSKIMWLYYNESTGIEAEKTYAKAQEIIDSLGITKNTTQKEAIILINNYLCDLKTYAQATDATLYGSLTETVGVCHNYAEAFQILCLTAGIECQYYSSKEMNHAWNCVYFSDGTHLWVDVTWNDSVYTNDRSRYLLVDDATFGKTHKIN